MGRLKKRRPTFTPKSPEDIQAVAPACLAHRIHLSYEAEAEGKTREDVVDPTTAGEEALGELALRAVAQLTKGECFLAMNREELAGVYEQLDQIETREVKTASHRP